MATSKKSTTVPSSTRPSRLPQARIVQNFHLVWLDGNINEDNDDCRNSITKLQQVVTTVNTFIDADECIDFITDSTEEKVFMVISGQLSHTISPIAQDISQVSAVYIFSGNQISYEKWAQQWPKIKGVYTDITPICEALKQAIQDCDQNAVSISLVKTTVGRTNQRLNTLDCSFMYTQILKEILLTIDFEERHINAFLSYCREQLAGNNTQMNNVEKLRREYREHQPIWWYTYNSFLYSMLNRALRLMEVDLIVKMGFFVRDLHNHIVALHSEQYGGHNHSDSFTVYRGQGLSQTDFDRLKSTQSGLLAFNNFLSTSLDRTVSLNFARRTINTSDLVGVLFIIKIDPSISVAPFANVKNVSCFQREEEILFSMHSVFRIGQVEQLEKNNRLWQVDLALTGEDDPQLHNLTESMQEEIGGSTGWHRLGKLMIKMGQFDKVEELYEILRQQTTDERGYLYQQLGLIKSAQGKYAEALSYCEQALEIRQNTLPANHPHLATSYNNMGTMSYNMNHYSKALSYLERALDIRQRSLPPKHPNTKAVEENIEIVKKKL